MKLHVFGASGTGVTTLGRALAATLAWPYLDSDDYFWLPTQPAYTQCRPPAARNALLTADMARQPQVVVGGSLGGWGEEWFRAFDLAVFLWLPSALRLQRLAAREQQRYGAAVVVAGSPGQPHCLAGPLRLPRAGTAQRHDRGRTPGGGAGPAANFVAPALRAPSVNPRAHCGQRTQHDARTSKRLYHPAPAV